MNIVTRGTGWGLQFERLVNKVRAFGIECLRTAMLGILSKITGRSPADVVTTWDNKDRIPLQIHDQTYSTRTP